MAKKIYDLAIKTGTYTNSSAETKGRWQNVGAVMQGDDGGKFVMLSKWFNPAGVPDLNGRDATRESILLSMFEPKQQGGQTEHGAAKSNAYQPQPAAADEDIPF